MIIAAVSLNDEKMKKAILLLFTLALLSVQYSCSSEATSAEIGKPEIQEISISRNVNVADFQKILEVKEKLIKIDS